MFVMCCIFNVSPVQEIIQLEFASSIQDLLYWSLSHISGMLRSLAHSKPTLTGYLSSILALYASRTNHNFPNWSSPW